MRLIDADALYDKFDVTMQTLVKSTAHENIDLEALSLLCGAKLISDAPTITHEPGWISVKDRLPENGKDILAYLNNGEETRIAPCNYYNGVWYDSVMNCICVMKDVTHWMSLPEPPKEE